MQAITSGRPMIAEVPGHGRQGRDRREWDCARLEVFFGKNAIVQSARPDDELARLQGKGRGGRRVLGNSKRSPGRNLNRPRTGLAALGGPGRRRGRMKVNNPIGSSGPDWWLSGVFAPPRADMFESELKSDTPLRPLPNSEDFGGSDLSGRGRNNWWPNLHRAGELIQSFKQVRGRPLARRTAAEFSLSEATRPESSPACGRVLRRPPVTILGRRVPDGLMIDGYPGVVRCRF